MARFFRHKTKADALRGVAEATKAIKGFRENCQADQRDQETLYNFATICAMLALAHDRGEKKEIERWQRNLREFINGFAPMAKRLARHFAMQTGSIAEAQRLGATPREVAEALEGRVING